MSFESKNPTTGELLGTYPEHSAHEIEQRLQSAWDGWKHWSRTPLSERTAFLLRLANLLESRVEEYARLITLEMGKPIGQAYNELAGARARIRYFLDQSERWLEEEWVTTDGATREKIVYEPLGIIANISGDLAMLRVASQHSCTG